MNNFKPQLANAQETLLEELIQKSFGAQNFYTPIRYKRRAGEDEPCDLFWENGTDIILFYLKTGKKSIEKQDAHNLGQAAKWIRRWSNNTNLNLEGMNRFSDKCIAKFESYERIVCISIISHDTGIVFHPANTIPNGFICTIPEFLVHAISSLNGTVIDLLELLYEYSNNLSSHIINFRSTGYERLINTIIALQKRHFAALDYLKKLSLDNFDNDFNFVCNLLGICKCPDPIGSKILSTKGGRDQVVEYFGDMSSLDILNLAGSSIHAINTTKNKKYSVFARTNNLYLNWNIIATSLTSNNFSTTMNNCFDAIKNTPYEHLPMIVFGYDFDFADYRSPMMYVLPPSRNISQASHLIISISNKINRIYQMRSNQV